MSRFAGRLLLLGVLLASVTGCTTKRFITTTRGAPLHVLTFVNDCREPMAHIFLDLEYENKERPDVRPRRIKRGESSTFRLTAGRHMYVAELFSASGDITRVTQPPFLLNRDATIRVCAR